MNRATAKPLVIATTGFSTVITLLLWFISMSEFAQLHLHGPKPLELPPFAYVLHLLCHPSMLLPFVTAVCGSRLLQSREPPTASVSRYCSYFILAACIWALVAILGLYTLDAMHRQVL